METIDFQGTCDEALKNVKMQPWFPFKTGNLKFKATSGQMVKSNQYLIKIDGSIAPYAEYLEEGTEAHNIPGAFGRALPFGTFGRFNGKFHPGSKKHMGFIKNKMIPVIIFTFLNKYGGFVK